MSVFIDTSNIKALDEAYVGETAFVKKLLELISIARSPYVGKMKRPIKSDKNFIKIGDLLADEFGFCSVDFSVPFDISYNAFTYPITLSRDLELTKVKPKFKQNKGFYYNEQNKLCILVCVTSGVWFDEKFTDREVAAAILHEIGHSFVLQSKRMIDIIEATRLTLVVNALKKQITTAASSGYAKDWEFDRLTNEGREMVNKVHKEIADDPNFKDMGSPSVMQYVGIAINQIFTEIFAAYGIMYKIVAIPFALLNKLMAPLFDKNSIASGRSQEYLSDSFAMTYGLGPEISSFLLKIEFSPSTYGSKVDATLSKMPIIGALHKSLDIPVLLLTNEFNTHPSTPARIDKILEELNYELKQSDLSPKTKAAIKDNIKQLEDLKKECIEPSAKNKLNGETVQRMWISYLSKQNESRTELEDYYTDMKTRDKYLKGKSKKK